MTDASPHAPKSTAVAEIVKKAGDQADEKPGRLILWVSIVMAVGAAFWLAGFLFLRAGGEPTRHWNILWGLSGISFLFAIFPLPGITATLLLAISGSWVLGTLGVAGAAVGGTAAAGLLLALGHEGRAYLRKRATHSKRAKKFLEWSQKAAKKWTYAGVFVLLIPQFIPRAVTLYAAVLAKLKTLPFLATVLAGTFVRNFVMLVGFHYSIQWLGL